LEAHVAKEKRHVFSIDARIKGLLRMKNKKQQPTAIFKKALL